jgi:hypothetical protein
MCQAIICIACETSGKTSWEAKNRGSSLFRDHAAAGPGFRDRTLGTASDEEVEKSSRQL